MESIKILLVDDHQLIRHSLRSFLNEESKYQVVGQASNGAEALKLIGHLKVDVVVIDINMDQMNGIDCGREIILRYPNIKLIALTIVNDSAHIKEMLQAGASGYLLKSCTIEEVKTAISTVNAGGSYYSPEVTTTIMQNLQGKKLPRSSSNISVMPITPREKEILGLIMKEYSNQEVADQLCISIRTVEAHKRNIIEKTGCRNTAGLVVYAIKHHLFDMAS